MEIRMGEGLQYHGSMLKWKIYFEVETINVYTGLFESRKKHIYLGLFTMTDYVRTLIEKYTPELEVELPKPSLEYHPEATDDGLLKNNMVSMMLSFDTINKKLKSICDTTGGTNSLNELAEEYRQELPVFETMKDRIAQTLFNWSTALIDEIMELPEHVQELLDLPSTDATWSSEHNCSPIRSSM
ncbi:unnamed protein product [Linum trigynum]|uniref:Uncharacterized protein n=1 Tax=Linum trigynum TaxID=586398 RepID=A0AAV2D3Y9_9ROSI